jgi:hypothetical protein
MTLTCIGVLGLFLLASSSLAIAQVSCQRTLPRFRLSATGVALIMAASVGARRDGLSVVTAG